MNKTASRLFVPFAALALITAACSSDDNSSDPTTPAVETTEATPATDPPTEPTQAPEPSVAGDIVVFAAASLTESFTEAADAFTAANPDAHVTFSFDASSALVQQIIEGAPADAFASADLNNMKKLSEAELNATEPTTFATNLLTIIVAPGNPLGLTGVADLENTDIKTVICAAEVPCGNYANQIFEAAGINVTPVSFEQNVRGVTTKVVEGEADAGIVYVTDVIAAGDKADLVEIPTDINVIAQYPIATVAGTSNADVVDAFIAFLLGDEGQAILAKYGFEGP